MPSIGEDKKELNARAYQIKKRNAEAQTDLDKIKDFDASGQRLLAEARSLAELQRIYFGNGIQTNDDDDTPAKAKKKKKTPCNPSEEPVLSAPRKFINWDNPTDESTWIGLRHKARTNLFWLGVEALKWQWVSTTHQVVCDQFIQKDFIGAFKEGYTLGDVHRAINRQKRFDENGHPTKELMLLDPRGFFKSTIDGVDAVQWLLNCPDIRILILTGEYKLAESFLEEIKQYFYLADGSDASDFQLLFPEYVLTGVDGTSTMPLVSPARKIKQRAASVWVNAIVANLSGWHCDIKKGDDIVTDQNCTTIQTRAKIKKKYDGTRNILDEWGFADHIGTRYYPDDWYGKRIDIMGKGKGLVPMKYFMRQCWVVKPGFAEVDLKDLTESMVTLNFPEKATWDSLQDKLNDDIIGFRCQQLNEPAGDTEGDGFKIAFTLDVLRANIYQESAAPKIGDIFVIWDTALTANRTSDFSVGVAARVVEFSPGKKGLSVLEVKFDKWRQTELALQIVSFNKKWNPKQTLIETLSGAELLQMEVQRQAYRYEQTLNIWWKPPSTQPDAKRNRIKGLETLLSNGLLKFVSGGWIDETFAQLCRYTGERKNKGRKDDIPDALSYLAFFLPASSLLNGADQEEMKALLDAAKKVALAKMQYERIFGGPFVPRTEPTPERPQDQRGQFGIPGLRF